MAEDDADIMNELEKLEKGGEHGDDNDELNELKELEKLEKMEGKNDDEDLKELEALDNDEPKPVKQKAPAVNPAQKLKEIDTAIEECKASAKNASNEEKQELLATYKQLNNQKAELIAKHPDLKAAIPKVDKKAIALKKMAVELILPEKASYKSISNEDAEETLHNYAFMLAISVIENEQELLKKMGNHEYVTQKLDMLSSNKMMLESKVSNGIITPEQYLEDVQRQLNFENKLLAQAIECEAPSNHIARIKQRITLLNAELNDSSNEQQAEPEPLIKEEVAKKEAKEPKAAEPKKEQQIPKKEEQPKQKKEEAKKPQPPTSISEPKKPEPKKEPVKNDVAPKQIIQEEVKMAKSEYAIPDPPPIDINSSIVLKKDVIDFTKVDKEQYEKINTRLEEYRSAAEYYITYNVKERAEAMIMCAKKLKQFVDVIKSGNKVDILRAEPPLTPDIFLGMSAQAKAESKQLI